MAKELARKAQLDWIVAQLTSEKDLALTNSDLKVEAEELNRNARILCDALRSIAPRLRVKGFELSRLNGKTGLVGWGKSGKKVAKL